ncbi:MAG: type III pantothenate kinase [Anaerolineae bacterium]|nr:type III pantothenate kinase [Anaerolineae bacterium]
MMLAVDIGNTNILFGVHDGSGWRYHWRVRTVRDKMADEYGVLVRALLRESQLTLADFDRIVVASVVPPLTGRMEEMLGDETPVAPLVISHTVDTGLRYAIDNPSELGADLIADAVAAYARLGEACIVVDFGTATTFTAISGDGVVLGVAIAPGMNLAASALSGGTAQLPQVRLIAPQRAIGTNTVDSIRSGVVLGYVGLVEGMITRIQAEMASSQRMASDDIKVLATGGLVDIIAPLTERFYAVDPWLTLDGIRIIGERCLP